MDSLGADQPVKRKLIETSLPLTEINEESAREKSIRHGHPSTLHLYWSRKPLATSRAVLFAQLVDDPASRPEEFPTVEAQDRERQRLHDLMRRLVPWEAVKDPKVFQEAAKEIRKSNGGKLPAVLDPFAGGGSIPLEAQRLGLEAYASDLNPLAVLITKALIEIPSRFPRITPVSPNSELSGDSREGVSGVNAMATDIRYYGQWLRDEAEKRIGHHYPKVMDENGVERTVIAYKWARTVRNPNPANPIAVPLVSSWWLSKKKGKEAWIEPQVVNGGIRYRVHHNADGPTKDVDGTVHRSGMYAVSDGTPFSYEYVRKEGKKGNVGEDLIAIVCEGDSGRLYLTANDDDEPKVARPSLLAPSMPNNPRYCSPPLYGFDQWTDLYTDRQLLAMTTFTDLVPEVRERVLADALAAGMESGESYEDGGTGAEAYADAIATYLALAVSRLADYGSSLCSWNSARDGIRNVFTRQAIPMIWDFAEANPFSSSSGNFLSQVEWVTKAVATTPAMPKGIAQQLSATTRDYSGVAISTDPPYYDNIGYSDLSDYFYVWLRRSLQGIMPSAVATMLTPKAEELVANPYRHGTKAGAQKFFVDGFNQVFTRIRQSANTDVPMTVYYAYKQQDSKGGVSTGWHTLLSGLIDAGWEITATWPMRSERKGRLLSQGTNALASSIVLACRPRSPEAPAISRRQFVAQLREELPEALRKLMQGNMAPVDLAQAAIGPGISVFSRYSQVREADGTAMSVRDALALVNETLDAVIDDQESDFDEQTRFAVKWYRSYGWKAESSGMADQLARAADTSIPQLERTGFFETAGGKARLLPPAELSGNWNIEADPHVSVWEAVVRLAGILSVHGVDEVAKLMPFVAGRVNLDSVKELGFLLFREAEKKGQSQDAQVFNALVTMWADLDSAARRTAPGGPEVEETLGDIF